MLNKLLSTLKRGRPDNHLGDYVTYRVKSQTFLSVLFVAVVLITSALSFSGIRTWKSLAENRSLAQIPPFSASALFDRRYFSKLNEWGSDHQAFRTPLIALSSAIKLRGFRVATNQKVIPGKSGWFYYGMGTMRRDFARENQLSTDYLRRIRIYLAELDAWSRANDIAVVFAVAPNKHNVYPDNMPDDVVRGTGPGNAEILDQFLQRTYPQMAAPLTSALQSGKATRQVYYKIDTHWNAMGGLIGAQAILKTLRPQLTKPLAPQSQFIETSSQFGPGNFGRMMGLPLVETELKPVPPEGFGIKRDPKREKWVKRQFAEPPRVVQIYNSAHDEAPRALILGDSFMRSMSKYLAMSFSQTLLINLWHNEKEPQIRFPLGFIRTYKPDSIIIELVERRIRDCAKCKTTFGAKLPTGVRQVRLKALFEDGDVPGQPALLKPVSANSDRLVLGLPSGVKPTDVIIARLTTPKGLRGHLTPAVEPNLVPEDLRHEQTSTRLNEQQTEYYMVLVPDPDGANVTLKHGEGLDLQDLSFELRVIGKDRLLPGDDLKS